MPSVRVWDLPLRLFHWLLAVLVAGAVLTAEIGGNLMDWHGRLGLAVLGLVIFRLAWGFVGSTHSRFASFFPTLRTMRAYLRGEWRGLGHSPAGALAAFALLAVLSLQAGTGLFANDDIAFKGPLYGVAGEYWNGRLTGIHDLAGNVLIALIALHLAAIAFYARVKRVKLVAPMFTGRKEIAHGEEGRAPPPVGGGILALILAVALAVAAVWFIGSGRMADWLAPPPPAAEPAPAW